MCQIYFEKLQIINCRLKELYENKQINPKIADDLILIAQQKVKLFFKDVFENNLKDLVSNETYNEFVLYSYKSYYGEIPAQTTDNKKIYKRRLNLFRMGKRWSDSTGNIFYSVIDKINEKFGDTPINLFGELSSKYNKRILRIITSNESKCNVATNTITLPTHDILKEIKVDGIAISGQFRTYMELLIASELHNNSVKLAGIEIAIREFKVEQLLNLVKSNNKVLDFVNGIKNFYGMNDDDFILYKDRIIKALFTYQFNDLEFDLYLFFPDCNEFLSTLMIALNQKKIINEEQQKCLLEITDNLKFLEEFEKNVVQKTKKSNDTYIMWKNIYEREYDKLFTFMRSVENICYSVCKQNGISFSHKDGRVKTFESLYNKIYIRSNDSVENEKLKNKHQITYKEAIEEPHLHYNKVFNIIRDLAGVRIVLLFEEDLELVKEIFETLNRDEDLIVKDVKFYKQSIEDEDSNIPPADKERIFNYRSLHVTVKPGKNRLNLIEYRNLVDVQCEIQFRSVLAHAWADVNHDLDYKHRDVIKEVLPDTQNLLKKDFADLSEKLLKNDKFLNSIREKGSKIKLD